MSTCPIRKTGPIKKTLFISWCPEILWATVFFCTEWEIFSEKIFAGDCEQKHLELIRFLSVSFLRSCLTLSRHHFVITELKTCFIQFPFPRRFSCGLLQVLDVPCSGLDPEHGTPCSGSNLPTHSPTFSSLDNSFPGSLSMHSCSLPGSNTLLELQYSPPTCD